MLRAQPPGSPELSGLGDVLGTAISEDPDTGVTQLRVGSRCQRASLAKSPTEVLRTAAPSEATALD